MRCRAACVPLPACLLGAGVTALAASGPALAFRGLGPAWTIAQALLLALVLLLLVLVAGSDPGDLPAEDGERADALVADIVALALAADVRPVLRVSVRHGGADYRCDIADGSCVRLSSGARRVCAGGGGGAMPRRSDSAMPTAEPLHGAASLRGAP